MKKCLFVLVLLAGCGSKPVVEQPVQKAQPPTGLMKIYGPKCPRNPDPALASNELLASRLPDGEVVVEKGVDVKRIVRSVAESFTQNYGGLFDACKQPKKKK